MSLMTGGGALPVKKSPKEDVGPEGPLQSKQEAQVMAQYAAARKNLQNEKGRGLQDLQGRIDRSRAISGMKGGSALKAEQKQLGEFEKAFTGASTNLDAQEAAAKQAALADLENKQFAAQEAAKGRNFAASESALAREQQQSQFKDTLAFQSKSFEDQMAFQLKEFEENLKTNIINAGIAIRDAGLDNPEKIARVLGGLKDLKTGNLSVSRKGSY